MRIYFENGAEFITASSDDGEVIIRCNFDYTDCGMSENLNSFILRHGGEVACADYLTGRYVRATKP